MRKILTLGAAAAALCAVAVLAPASAADRTSEGVHNGAAAQTDFSARRYYRHYSHRYYGHRYYGRRYYGAPYYAYSPRYYGYRHHYRRPGVYFGFGF
jgi:hypothetical protein